jgi:hypothetical protein
MPRSLVPMSGSAREFPRFALEATVELTARGFVAKGRTSNVSRGGLAATVDRAIAPGEVVTVRMALVFDEDTFSEPLDLPVRVVWCTQLAEVYQLGMAFLALSSDQRTYLEMFLRYLEEGAMRHRESSPPESDEPDIFG